MKILFVLTTESFELPPLILQWTLVPRLPYPIPSPACVLDAVQLKKQM